MKHKGENPPRSLIPEISGDARLKLYSFSILAADTPAKEEWQSPNYPDTRWFSVVSGSHTSKKPDGAHIGGAKGAHDPVVADHHHLNW